MLAMIFCGLVFINAWAGAASSQGSETLAGNNTSLMLSGLPDVRQSTEYSCGAASLESVLAYYGRDIDEENLRELLGTTAESGTYPDDIVRVAEELGFQAAVKENLTITDLEEGLGEGVPIMVDGQAWRSSYEFNDSWSDIVDDGHWMVVIGIDEKNVYLEDPYILGSRGYMPLKEFEQRWHNARGLTPSDTVRQNHLGVFIRDDKPAKSVPFKHID
jgi:predicted double-glycine peptidase